MKTIIWTQSEKGFISESFHGKKFEISKGVDGEYSLNIITQEKNPVFVKKLYVLDCLFNELPELAEMFQSAFNLNKPPLFEITASKTHAGEFDLFAEYRQNRFCLLKGGELDTCETEQKNFEKIFEQLF